MQSNDGLRSYIGAAILLERLGRDIYPSRHSAEIQPLQWSVLRYLARSSPERRQLRWIARYLGLTRAPVQRAVGKLIRRGLVVQEVSELDSRTNTISLTDSGNTVLDQDPILEMAKDIYALEDSDRASFLRSIRTLALSKNLDPGDEK